MMNGSARSFECLEPRVALLPANYPNPVLCLRRIRLRNLHQLRRWLVWPPQFPFFMDCEKIKRLDLFSQALLRVRSTFFASAHSGLGKNAVMVLMRMDKGELVSLSKLVGEVAKPDRRSSF